MAKKRAKKKRSTKSKRVAKRKTTRKKKVSKKKPSLKKAKPKQKKAPAKRKGPELPAEPIGRVTHYFSKARATAFLIERDEVRLGDILYFKGHTTNFKQTVESLQINRQPVSQASPGEEVGIRTKSRTREHDLVFKL